MDDIYFVVNLDPVCFIEILIEEMPWIISQELASLFIVHVNIFCNNFYLTGGRGINNHCLISFRTRRVLMNTQQTL